LPDYRVVYEDYELVLKPKPSVKKLYVEFSALCNYACPMCFRHSFKDELSLMETDVWKKLLKDVDDLPELEWIVLGGIGEPTVHPDFETFVCKLKDKGKKIAISTNGSLLHEERVEFLTNIGVEKLIVSFETGDFGHPWGKRVEENLIKLKETKKRKGVPTPHLTLEWVLTKENLDSAEEIFEVGKRLGAEEVMFTNLLPVRKEYERLVLYDEPQKYEEKVKSLYLKARGRFRVILPELKLLTERHCAFVESKAMVIRWDGEVAPCYRFLHHGTEVVQGMEKEVKAVSFGNVINTSLKRIWMSFDYSFFRYKVKNALFPSCNDCNFRNGCQFIETTEEDCWGNTPSCADCLWWRKVVLCP